MKRIIAFVICCVLIFAMSTVAFADSPTPRTIAMKCSEHEDVYLYEDVFWSSTILGQYNYGELFWAIHDQYYPWYVGRVDENTKIYEHYGERITGCVHDSEFEIYSVG